MAPALKTYSNKNKSIDAFDLLTTQKILRTKKTITRKKKKFCYSVKELPAVPCTEALLDDSVPLIVNINSTFDRLLQEDNENVTTDSFQVSQVNVTNRADLSERVSRCAQDFTADDSNQAGSSICPLSLRVSQCTQNITADDLNQAGSNISPLSLRVSQCTQNITADDSNHVRSSISPLSLRVSQCTQDFTADDSNQAGSNFSPLSLRFRASRYTQNDSANASNLAELSEGENISPLSLRVSWCTQNDSADADLSESSNISPLSLRFRALRYTRNDLADASNLADLSEGINITSLNSRITQGPQNRTNQADFPEDNEDLSEDIINSPLSLRISQGAQNLSADTSNQTDFPGDNEDLSEDNINSPLSLRISQGAQNLMADASNQPDFPEDNEDIINSPLNLRISQGPQNLTNQADFSEDNEDISEDIIDSPLSLRISQGPQNLTNQADFPEDHEDLSEDISDSPLSLRISQGPQNLTNQADFPEDNEDLSEDIIDSPSSLRFRISRGKQNLEDNEDIINSPLSLSFRVSQCVQNDRPDIFGGIDGSPLSLRFRVSQQGAQNVTADPSGGSNNSQLSLRFRLSQTTQNVSNRADLSKRVEIRTLRARHAYVTVRKRDCLQMDGWKRTNTPKMRRYVCGVTDFPPITRSKARLETESINTTFDRLLQDDAGNLSSQDDCVSARTRSRNKNSLQMDQQERQPSEYSVRPQGSQVEASVYNEAENPSVCTRKRVFAESICREAEESLKHSVCPQDVTVEESVCNEAEYSSVCTQKRVFADSVCSEAEKSLEHSMCPQDLTIEESVCNKAEYSLEHPVSPQKLTVEDSVCNEAENSLEHSVCPQQLTVEDSVCNETENSSEHSVSPQELTVEESVCNEAENSLEHSICPQEPTVEESVCNEAENSSEHSVCPQELTTEESVYNETENSLEHSVRPQEPMVEASDCNEAGNSSEYSVRPQETTEATENSLEYSVRPRKLKTKASDYNEAESSLEIKIEDSVYNSSVRHNSSVHLQERAAPPEVLTIDDSACNKAENSSVNYDSLLEIPYVSCLVSSTPHKPAIKCPDSSSSIIKTNDRQAKVCNTRRINSRPLSTLSINDSTVDVSDVILIDDSFVNPIRRHYIRPGKLWRRALSVYKKDVFISKASANTPDPVCQAEEDPCGSQKYKQTQLPEFSVCRKSVRLVPDSPPKEQSKRLSLISRYARRTSYAPNDIQGALEQIFEGLSVNAADETLHLPIEDDGNETAAPFVTARDIVLRRCGQTEPIPFAECYPQAVLKNCQKIGEGVYGEVFLFRNKTGTTSIMKVIPIEGDLIVNGERQKKFEEILTEIIIAMELSDLRKNKKNSTSGFNEVSSIHCVQGQYPARLLDLWDLYDEVKGSQNDCPDAFGPDQLYIVLELTNGGKDVESFVFNNAMQAFSLFQQAACSLAVAEVALQFEHRDLHWGNILVSETDKKKSLTYNLSGRQIEVPSRGVQISIIDFTLSRITFDSVCIYNDLGQDPDLFNAEGDYQFELYRLMQKCNHNEWQHFEPYTNILWLHYLLDKMITALRYKYPRTKCHNIYMDKLKQLKGQILDFKSVEEFVTQKFF